jgi:hypothetical protein
MKGFYDKRGETLIYSKAGTAGTINVTLPIF